MRSTAKDVGATRRVYGWVSSTGAIANPGSADWTITKSATGVYVILFLRPFVTMPVVQPIVTSQGGYATPSPSVGGVTISTFTTAGAATDSAFAFSVEGRG